jgi:hypothetical protein
MIFDDQSLTVDDTLFVNISLNSKKFPKFKRVPKRNQKEK